MFRPRTSEYQCRICGPDSGVLSYHAMRLHMMESHGYYNPTPHTIHQHRLETLPNNRGIQPSATDKGIQLNATEFTSIIAGLTESVQQGINHGLGNTLQASAAMMSLFSGNHSFNGGNNMMVSNSDARCDYPKSMSSSILPPIQTPPNLGHSTKTVVTHQQKKIYQTVPPHREVVIDISSDSDSDPENSIPRPMLEYIEKKTPNELTHGRR